MVKLTKLKRRINMKIILRKNAAHKTYNSACSVTEYGVFAENMDIAVAHISGRYPLENRTVNEISNELAYVCEGDGKIVIEGQTYPLSAGDVVMIDAGEKYYWEGQMKLVMSCRPIWQKEQHKIVE